MTDAPSAERYYLYGVVPAAASLPSQLVGVAGESRLALHRSEDLAMLASPVATDWSVANRDDLLAHSRVLDTVAATGPVLPLRFGTVAQDSDEIERILSDGRQAYESSLAELEGAVQFTLHVKYEREVVLRELVAENQEIAELTEATRADSGDATYPQRVRLGELVVARLTEKGTVDAVTVIDALTPHTRAAQTLETGGPDDVLHAAYLVDLRDVQKLEAAADDVGRQMSGRVRLRMVGPQAPYDFVAQD